MGDVERKLSFSTLAFSPQNTTMSRTNRTPLGLLGALSLMALPSAQAATCYSTFRGYYECNGSGLSTGARWGIGVGLVVGIILLCMAVSYWRRK